MASSATVAPGHQARPRVNAAAHEDFTSRSVTPISAASGGPDVLKSAANAGLGSTIRWGLREVHKHHTPLDLVRERSPERPVALARPGVVAVAARWFQDSFQGDVFYAVKANPSAWVIDTLAQNGVASFDVASIPEIELVTSRAPGARMA